MIKLIYASDLNGGIGFENKLLTKLNEDLYFFKEKTKNHTVIMGRKTFESLPFVLPKRKNVIISSNYSYEHPNVYIFNNLMSAINYFKNEEIFIIGGAQIYNECLKNNIVDVVYQTLILNRFESDAKISDSFIFENFNLVSSNTFFKNNLNDDNFIINKYVKK